MKAENDEEIAERDRLMEEALEHASAVPLQIMDKCGRAIELSVAFAKRGAARSLSAMRAPARFYAKQPCRLPASTSLSIQR